MSRILIIAPHADDEVLGVGATISKLKNEGDIVSVIIVTERKYPGLTEQNAQITNCHKTLNYDNLYNLRLEDEYLDRSVVDIAKAIEPIYNKLSPDILYTCFSGDNNQDHRAVFDAVCIVCRPHANKKLKRLYCYEVPSSTDQTPAFTRMPFVPNIYSEITEQQLAIKQLAMSCYAGEVRSYPNPRSAMGIEVLARKRGMECNAEYAEAFMLVYGKD